MSKLGLEITFSPLLTFYLLILHQPDMNSYHTEYFVQAKRCHISWSGISSLFPKMSMRTISRKAQGTITPLSLTNFHVNKTHSLMPSSQRIKSQLVYQPSRILYSRLINGPRNLMDREKVRHHQGSFNTSTCLVSQLLVGESRLTWIVLALNSNIEERVCLTSNMKPPLKRALIQDQNALYTLFPGII